MNEETKLVKAILSALKYDRAVLALRINSGMRVGSRAFRGAPAGTSDIMASVAGRFCALEVKVGKGKLSPIQEAFMAQVRATGGFGCGVWSVDEAMAAVARCKAGGAE